MSFRTVWRIVLSKALNQPSAWNKIRNAINQDREALLKVRALHFSHYLSFTDAWFRELNVFSLPAVHPDSNNTVCLLIFTSARVFEAKVCYVVKQLQQMPGHLENTQKGEPN